MRVHALQASQAGKTLHVGQCERAQPLAVDGVKAVFFFQIQKGKALVQVALNGAQVDAEIIHQRMRVEPFAFIEAAQDFGQPEGQGVGVVGFAGHSMCSG